jgi:hypothetical protein
MEIVGNLRANDSGEAPSPLLVSQWLRLAYDVSNVAELRALGVRERYGAPRVHSGYFDPDHLLDYAREALKLDFRAKGIYCVMNRLVPDLIARRQNKVEIAGPGDATADQHVERRTRILIDCDPIRPVKDTSATDEEKAAAGASADAVKQYLTAKGWPEPILADSGNGYYLLYAIDLPVNDGGLVQRILGALAQRFDTARVKIDQSVHNPARISKVYGTMARKGDDYKGDPARGIPSRPHRRSALLFGPEVLSPVPQELLEKLAAEFKGQTFVNEGHTNGQVNGQAPSASSIRLDMERWLNDKGIGFKKKPEVDNLGREVWILDVCPHDPAHGHDSCVMQARSGKLSAKCLHAGCAGKGWEEFKKAIG